MRESELQSTKNESHIGMDRERTACRGVFLSHSSPISNTFLPLCGLFSLTWRKFSRKTSETRDCLAKLFNNILFCFPEQCSFGYGLKVMCQSGLPPLNPQGWGEGGSGTVTKISINRWGIYSQEVLLVLFSIFPHESSVESSTI